MDIYGSVSTAVDQIYRVTVFIQGVISDVKSFEQDKATIQLKLELQLASLQFFEQRFLDPEHGLMLPGHLPDRVREAFKHLLDKMKSVLAEYEVLVLRYNMSDKDDGPDDTGPGGRDKWKKSFVDRFRTKAKTLKLKGYDWSLFDKEKLIAIIDEYKHWADNLRDLMQHFSQEAVYSLTDAMGNMNLLKGTGLEPVAKRQKIASAKAPDSFDTLSGNLTEEGTRSNSFQLAQLTANGESQRVIVEYHGYDSRLKVEDLEPDEIAELKAPVRNLAWLLQNSTFSEGDDDPSDSEQPTIYSLQCLGFIDQQEQERTAFLYKLPRGVSGDDATNLVTLHELINNIDPTTRRVVGKPSLGGRFNIAHCLALTLSNVHGSRWLHKNIWSRGILLFQQNSDTGIRPFAFKKEAVAPGTTPKQDQVLAFLGDWGYARPEQAATELRSDFEIEPNMYRHPERQGRPTRQFDRTHDLYALGVVLLETGLWRTVSQLFEKAIKEAQKSGRLPKAKDVRNALVTLAQTELPKEMGDAYAVAVVSCLCGKFKHDSDMELSLDFREKVVDAIARGRKL
jgi:hypothetical protein